MEKESQFIPKQDSAGAESLFNELGTELDFGATQASQWLPQNTKKHPLEIAKLVTGLLVGLTAIIAFVTTIDATIRNLEDNWFLSQVGLCSYYTLGVSDLDSTQCGSYTQTKDEITTKKADLEKNLGETLALVIPKKLVTANVAKLPEVGFILQKTGTNRISLSEVAKNFILIKNTATEYQGKDIDCEKMTLNEKGELIVRCDFYGFPLLTSDATPFTSRSTALAFLAKIQDSSSGFTLLEQPKSLEIEKFSSTDAGLRSTFSTRTSLNLRLRYSAPNKI